jgi:hypothetical protein
MFTQRLVSAIAASSKRAALGQQNSRGEGRAARGLGSSAVSALAKVGVRQEAAYQREEIAKGDEDVVHLR